MLCYIECIVESLTFGLTSFVNSLFSLVVHYEFTK